MEQTFKEKLEIAQAYLSNLEVRIKIPQTEQELKVRIREKDWLINKEIPRLKKGAKQEQRQ